ncbi:hypothetical protein, partial [Burkholderia sp. Cy-647]|uniref:hypothetical protein n=1 Tax=Burkholderia sp. Cy-647 TaxID=2608328 RepID=UPI0019640CC5
SKAVKVDGGDGRKAVKPVNRAKEAGARRRRCPACRAGGARRYHRRRAAPAMPPRGIPWLEAP